MAEAQAPRGRASAYAAQRWAIPWAPAFESQRQLHATFVAVANYARQDRTVWSASEFGPIAVGAEMICKGVMGRPPIASSKDTVRDHLVALTLVGLLTPGCQQYALEAGVNAIGTGVRVMELNDRRIASTSATVAVLSELVAVVVPATNRRFGRPRPPKDLSGVALENWRITARQQQLEEQALLRDRAMKAIRELPAALYGGEERREALLNWAFADRDLRQNVTDSGLWPAVDCQFSPHWQAADRAAVLSALVNRRPVPEKWAPLPIDWSPVVVDDGMLRSYQPPMQWDMAPPDRGPSDVDHLKELSTIADGSPAVTESVADFDARVTDALSDGLDETEPTRQSSRSNLPPMTSAQGAAFREALEEWKSRTRDLHLSKSEIFKLRYTIGMAAVRNLSAEQILAALDHWRHDEGHLDVPSFPQFEIARAALRKNAGTPTARGRAIARSAGQRSAVIDDGAIDADDLLAELNGFAGHDRDDPGHATDRIDDQARRETAAAEAARIKQLAAQADHVEESGRSAEW